MLQSNCHDGLCRLQMFVGHSWVSDMAGFRQIADIAMGFAIAQAQERGGAVDLVAIPL